MRGTPFLDKHPVTQSQIEGHVQCKRGFDSSFCSANVPGALCSWRRACPDWMVISTVTSLQISNMELPRNNSAPLLSNRLLVDEDVGQS